MREIDLLKVINILNIMFIFLIGADILVCFLQARYLYMYSSIILFSGLIFSVSALIFSKLKAAITITLFSFYIVGFFHTCFIGSYITCYFILLVAPLLCVFLFDTIKVKVVITLVSCLLFLLCNYLAGIYLFSNYFFFFGLIPSVITLLYFNERLKTLTNEKNLLIDDLKNKNEEVLLYTNMMSHDLKAPLRSINGFSKILNKRLINLKEKDKEILNFIIKGGKSMNDLIDDLLLYSKSGLEEYEFENIDLEKLIDSILFSFNYDIENKNVQIDRIDLGNIIANKKTISLVFQNLISNSLKYQPKEKEHPIKIIIQQKLEKNQSIVSIEDNGIGMNKENLEKLFLPFVRFHSACDYEGTGLGLSIVQKIVEKHNGDISVESKEGTGTKFMIRFPN